MFPYNTPRFSPGTGHVEQWSLCAQAPDGQRALWVQATVRLPLEGPPEAEVSIGLYAEGRSWAARQRVPMDESLFSGEPLRVEIGDCSFRFGATGSSRGGLTSPLGKVRWELSWEADPAWGASHLLIRQVLPGSPGLTTPHPVLHLSGRLQWSGTTWEITRWPGLQRHHWGRAHAWTQAWAQGLFRDEHDAPIARVEAFSTTIQLGRLRLPSVSAMVVHHKGRIFRFDRLYDLWAQQVELSSSLWRLALRGRAGSALLEVNAEPRTFTGLGMRNPDSQVRWCYRSPLARIELKVNPLDDAPFTLTTAHGGALELLHPMPDPRLPQPV